MRGARQAVQQPLACSLRLGRHTRAARAHARRGRARLGYDAARRSARNARSGAAWATARVAPLADLAASRAGRSRRPRTRSEHVNIVFIGHVDAGKSTIGGQILFLTVRLAGGAAAASRVAQPHPAPQGSVDERLIQKYEREAKEKNRESWYMVRRSAQRSAQCTRPQTAGDLPLPLSLRCGACERRDGLL